jgi:Snf7
MYVPPLLTPVLQYAYMSRYEAQIAQLEQQSWNMESTQLTTENLRNTMATVDAMKVANKELRRQYGKVDVDKIEVRVLLNLSCGLSYGKAGFTDSPLAIVYAIRYGGFIGTSKRDPRDDGQVIRRTRRD